MAQLIILGIIDHFQLNQKKFDHRFESRFRFEESGCPCCSCRQRIGTFVISKTLSDFSNFFLNKLEKKINNFLKIKKIFAKTILNVKKLF